MFSSSGFYRFSAFGRWFLIYRSKSNKAVLTEEINHFDDKIEDFYSDNEHLLIQGFENIQTVCLPPVFTMERAREICLSF